MYPMQVQTARSHNSHMPASDCTGAWLRAGSFNVPAELFWHHPAEGAGRQVSTLVVSIAGLGDRHRHEVLHVEPECPPRVLTAHTLILHRQRETVLAEQRWQVEAAVLKLLSRRCTCLEFHPTRDNIVLAGDKKGMIAIWDFEKVNGMP